MVGQVEERRPPIGTACLDCKFKGHICNAMGYKNRVPLCAYCMDGVACRVTQSELARAERGAHRSITGPPKPRPEPQPALARGAEPSPAMPARRVFPEEEQAAPKPKRDARERALEMLRNGMSTTAVMAAAGLAKATVCRLRKQLGAAPAMCSRGCGKPRHAGSCAGMLRNGHVLAATAEKVENVTVTTKVVECGAEKPQPLEDTMQQSEPSSKLSQLGYRVVSLAELPGRRYQGIYDEIVDELMKLPKLSVLTREFDNRDIADTYMSGIVRVARKRGLKMKQKQDGATIYVWQV